MARSSTPAAPVTTKFLTPEPTEEDQREWLYRPAPQLQGKPPFKVEYRWFTPEKATELLKHSLTDPDFRNRQTTVAQVRRHMNLMRTKRFVHFMPEGAICLDEQGIMLNGKNRMTAIAGQSYDIGLTVFRDVPRWMFKFMDTGRARTLKDVFYAGNRRTTPQTPSAMRLGMRYEEFLIGLRQGEGWRRWGAVKDDEHNDVDSFLTRRDEMQDWYGVGSAIQRKVHLIAASVMNFYFYQSLAWPEGADVLQEFCEWLITGGGWPGSPALALREWSTSSWKNGDTIPAKRELHLMLLFRCFAQFTQRTKVPKITWAYGHVMTLPYHPKGSETAIRNVRFALEEMDQLRR